MSGTAADSESIHPGDSSLDKSTVLELTKPNTGSAANCGNGSSNKPRPRTGHLGDFDKNNNLIDESVLVRTHPDLTGVRLPFAVDSLVHSSNV